MNRVSIAITIALASSTVFAQTAEINGVARTIAPDTVIAPPVACTDVECFLQNSNINHFRSSAGIMVQSIDDAIAICDFGIESGEVNQLTITVNDNGAKKTHICTGYK